jgi:hypothetical protein
MIASCLAATNRGVIPDEHDLLQSSADVHAMLSANI